MCGIIGIVGSEPVAGKLVDGLRRLEYRGYDSAGIATLVGSTIERRRAEGKLVNLAERVAACPIEGHVGIGHTRWATDGAPNVANTHPHATKRVAVVHNGIIENFQELRTVLRGRGCSFESETDTEVVVQLLTCFLDEGIGAVAAVRETLKRIEGAFALGIIFAG